MDYDDLPHFESMRTKARIHVRDKFMGAHPPRCNKKNGFKTKSSAEKKRNRLIKGGISYLRTYRCPACKNFHLTSQKPRI